MSRSWEHQSHILVVLVCLLFCMSTSVAYLSSSIVKSPTAALCHQKLRKIMVTAHVSSTGGNSSGNGESSHTTRHIPLPSGQEDDNGSSIRNPPPASPPRTVHHVTVCMVPPPEAEYVWNTVSEMRKQLKDPGYYRWPPHANLLYPFLEVTIPSENMKDETDTWSLSHIVDRLHSATRQMTPFRVQLNHLGTFGGRQRGVLWLSPDSSDVQPSQVLSTEQDLDNDPPLIQLHQRLEEAFPACKDQTKGGNFTPHMTLSHFDDLDSALQAKEVIERDFAEHLPKLDFVLDRISLLRRKGDSGQFLRLADIGLGADSEVKQWDSPHPFPSMPVEEERWVHDERMKLKARRNGNTKRGRGNRGGRRGGARSCESRVVDTPEVIESKRVERKAKRERLERKQKEGLMQEQDREID